MDRVALDILELSKAAGWGTLKALILSQLEEHNGRFLRSADPKDQGKYWATFDIYNLLAGLVTRGTDLQAELQERSKQ